ncbi:MAG: copper chaperone PCu(A)C [Ignavibacteria bacterium]|nr:copper chaperone PCu(A)C [Ignavibacteria bacterium]
MHKTFEENGMMGIRETGNMAIKPGETLKLKPRSFYVMLIGLKKELKKTKPMK